MDSDLYLSRDGDLWQIAGESARCLGYIGNSTTLNRVPPELYGRLEVLEGEWREMWEEGRGYRMAVAAAYRGAKR